MQTETQKKRPTHVIYQVIGERENAFWNRIGAAWLDKDGKGFSIKLDAIPTHGHINMREAKADESGQGFETAARPARRQKQGAS